MKKSKLISIIFLITSIISCKSIDTKNESLLTYNGNIQDKEIDYRNFDLSSLKYMYEGEEIYISKNLTENLKLVKIKYDNDNNLYAVVLDKKTNELKNVNLHKKIDVKPLEIVSYKRYVDIKNNDNDRINIVVNTFETPIDSGKEYFDLDDYKGEHRVLLEYQTEGKTVKRETNLEFGYKLSDFKDDYSTLLTSDLKLKFDDNKNIVGGFNSYYTDKIIDENVEYITEILDKDKESVGIHNVSRKIKVNGRVVYEKRDKAFIEPKGVTVAIVDESFADVSDLVENKIYRVTPKTLDKKNIKLETPEDTENYKKGLLRFHGTTSIGSMIDEENMGNSIYYYLLFLKNLVKSVNDDSYKKFDTSTYVQFNKKILTPFINLVVSKVSDENSSEIIQNLRRDLNNKVSMQLLIMEFLDLKNYVDNQDNITEEEKKKVLKKYKDIEDIIDSYLNITEDDKVKKSKLNFATISAASGDTVDVQSGYRQLANYLDENPNVKIVNMSYGNSLSLEEYKKLKNMTDDEKQKAADAFNNNIEYRVAILSWLKDVKNKLIKNYEESGKPYLDLSLYDYFEGRKSITKDDFDKIVKSRLSVYENILNSAPEYKLANKDVLFVRANGNGVSASEVNLTDFDENGNKIIYSDPNKVYSNGFSSIPEYLNEKNREKAIKENKEFKYDYSYRKNLISVVGLGTNLLPVGQDATEKISSDYNLFTISANLYKLKKYGVGVYDEYLNLQNVLLNKDNYSNEYIEEVKARIKVIDDIASKYPDDNDKSFKLSLSRAGNVKISAIGTDATYVYTKLQENGKVESKIEVGSSFAAPRVTTTLALLSDKFKFADSHTLKQILLTTANDGYVSEIDVVNEILEGTRKNGNYGVDDIVGWGVLDKSSALKGPRRFVKALTHEVDSDHFIANIENGEYKFELGIRGGFDKALYAYDKGEISAPEAVAYSLTKLYTDKEILEKDFSELLSEKAQKDKYVEYLNSNNITKETIVNKIRPNLNKYISTLPFSERELFEDAGLKKLGNGTLTLVGDNTYKGNTIVENGTLIVEGRLYSNVYVEKDSKLKLNNGKIEANNALNLIFKKDISTGGIFADLYNKGNLYSYSKQDKITGKYVPYNGSTTNLSSAALLTINKLDLSNINLFRVNVINKKDAKIFKEKEVDGNKIVEKEADLMIVKNISSEDIVKVSIGEKQITPQLKLKTEKENNGFKIKLVREEIVNNVVSAITSSEVREEMVNDLNKVIFYNDRELETLNGDLLTDSLLSVYDSKDIRDEYYMNILNTYNSGIFAGNLNKMILHNRDNKYIVNSINGVSLGGIYNLGYNKLGVSFDYLYEKLKDEKNNNLLGTSNMHSLAFNILNNVSYKGAYLNTISTFNYLTKDINRKIADAFIKTNSNDFMFSLQNELGYKFNFDVNNIKLGVTPYTRLDVSAFIRGKFDENTDFGYKSDTHTFVKSYVDLGVRFNVNYKNFDLETFVNYSKYLTDRSLNSNAEINKYSYSTGLNGVELKDHNVKVGISGKYNYNNYIFQMMYYNKNLIDNNLTISFGKEF